jgi:hypothetical protein
MCFDKLQEIRESLLGEGDGSTRDCLRHALAFLTDATLSNVFDQLCRHPENFERLMRFATHLDHLGFVTFRENPDGLKMAAEAAGFDDFDLPFPSTIIARELGGLVGTGPVPTAVFKLRRTVKTGTPLVVEVFLPQAIDPAVSRSWIGRARAVHLGIAIAEPESFREVIAIMAKEGFYPPEFMRGEPVANETEHMAAIYFDGSIRSQPVRIEFCHFAVDSPFKGESNRHGA